MRRIPFEQLLTLHDLAARTRVRPDVLQRWSAIGVLRPEEHTDHAGRGHRRRYARSELAIAALLKPLATWELPSGQLLRMATSIRRSLIAIRPGAVRDRDYAEGEPVLHGALERAAAGIGDNYLVVWFTPPTGVSFAVFEGDADNELRWPLAHFFRTAVPTPDAAVVIDLRVLREAGY